MTLSLMTREIFFHCITAFIKHSSSPTVIPLILITCQFGGKDKVFPEQFIDLDTEKTEVLMSYSTEGRGDDKVGGSSPQFTIMF